MKKYKTIYLLWPILAGLVLFSIACPLVNDASAAKVAQKIWELPLPPGTVRMEKTSAAGKLVGNGVFSFCEFDLRGH